MSLKKTFSKVKDTCKVTFKVEKSMANGATSAHLAGEFNQWNYSETPMKAAKDGSFSVILELETGKEYQYKFVLDEQLWENDAEADKYLPNEFGDENGVVIL